jgi:Icc-related predicted phosphoesterase
VAVLGNHDHECGQPEKIKHYLTQAGARILDGGESYEIHGVGFAGCMGAMGGFGRYMLSSFGEKSVKEFVHACMEEVMKLETSLRMLRTDRAVAVLHYAPVVDTLVGEPVEILPFLGNGRMAETVDRFENVRVVLHGHAHRGVHRGRTPKGVPVYNCAHMVTMAETGRPFALIEV